MQPVFSHALCEIAQLDFPDTPIKIGDATNQDNLKGRRMLEKSEDPVPSANRPAPSRTLFPVPSTTSMRLNTVGSLSADVTLHRIAKLEAENQSLRIEVERVRRLLNNVTDYAVITMNLGGRIIGWNAGACSILDYAADDVLGRSGEMFFVDEDRATGAFVDELCCAIEEGRVTNERWYLKHDGSRFWASGAIMPILDGDGRIEGFLNVFRDNTVGQADMERRALLLAEMGHRVKNTLATVQAVALQTLRGDGVPTKVQEALSARLMALARSHDLLIRGNWEGAPLADVVERALLPYGADRTSIGGASVQLPASAVEMLGLAFHELATNAAKYGALSVPEGRVKIHWDLDEDREGARIVKVAWRERNGPTVVPPMNRGFGSRLLESKLVQDLSGTVKLEFRPEGLECDIWLPITEVLGKV